MRRAPTRRRLAVCAVLVLVYWLWLSAVMGALPMRGVALF